MLQYAPCALDSLCIGRDPSIFNALRNNFETCFLAPLFNFLGGLSVTIGWRKPVKIYMVHFLHAIFWPVIRFVDVPIDKPSDVYFSFGDPKQRDVLRHGIERPPLWVKRFLVTRQTNPDTSMLPSLHAPCKTILKSKPCVEVTFQSPEKSQPEHEGNRADAADIGQLSGPRHATFQQRQSVCFT